MVHCNYSNIDQFIWHMLKKGLILPENRKYTKDLRGITSRGRFSGTSKVQLNYDLNFEGAN